MVQKLRKCNGNQNSPSPEKAKLITNEKHPNINDAAKVIYKNIETHFAIVVKSGKLEMMIIGYGWLTAATVC